MTETSYEVMKAQLLEAYRILDYFLNEDGEYPSMGDQASALVAWVESTGTLKDDATEKTVLQPL